MKLRGKRLDAEDFQRLKKMFFVLQRLVDEGVTWNGILTTRLLYSGPTAKQIKGAKDRSDRAKKTANFTHESNHVIGVDIIYPRKRKAVSPHMRRHG